MARFILPTGEIIAHFEHYNELFEFYEDGLRGVVRDLVVHCDGVVIIPKRRPMRYGYFHIAPKRSHVQKIVNEYLNSPTAVIQRMAENTSAESYVEIASEVLEETVAIMMAAIFANSIYSVSKYQYRWLGDDLMIEVVEIG